MDGDSREPGPEELVASATTGLLVLAIAMAIVLVVVQLLLALGVL